jgi:hypothetical protein
VNPWRDAIQTCVEVVTQVAAEGLLLSSCCLASSALLGNLQLGNLQLLLCWLQSSTVNHTPG